MLHSLLSQGVGLGASPFDTARQATLATAASSSSVMPTSSSKTPTGAGLYLRYAFAGALCCAITHSAVVPIDVVKTRIQLYPGRYSGLIGGLKTVFAEEGMSGLLLGLGPTAVGYAVQGTLKFGFYELFKATFAGAMEPETFATYRTFVFLGASACAEFFADLGLCPLEATRIRLVSNPSFANGLIGGFGRILREEGFMSFYRGLGPILFKQIPYTMAKFTVYEQFVAFVYSSLLGKSSSELSNGFNLSISLSGGVVAGAVAAVVSQPADTLLSLVNRDKVEGESTTAALRRLAAEAGLKGLFGGLGARVAMVATITAGQFFIYDGVKVMFGLPTTGGSTQKK